MRPADRPECERRRGDEQDDENEGAEPHARRDVEGPQRARRERVRGMPGRDAPHDDVLRHPPRHDAATTAEPSTIMNSATTRPPPTVGRADDPDRRRVAPPRGDLDGRVAASPATASAITGAATTA